MTTSAPFRSVSLCQTNSASCPSTCFAAWYASWSQFDPGKTTMLNFIRSRQLRLPVTSHQLPVCFDTGYSLLLLHNLHPVTLDHRVREELVRYFRGKRPRLVGRRGGHFELEVLALPDIPDPRVAERMQGFGNGLALGVEHRRLQRDEHARSHSFQLHARSCRRCRHPGVMRARCS